MAVLHHSALNCLRNDGVRTGASLRSTTDASHVAQLTPEGLNKTDVLSPKTTRGLSLSGDVYIVVTIAFLW